MCIRDRFDSEWAGVFDADGYGCQNLRMEYDPISLDNFPKYGDQNTWTYCRPAQDGSVPQGFIFDGMLSEEVDWMPPCSTNIDCEFIGTETCVSGICEHPGWVGVETGGDCGCVFNYTDCCTEQPDQCYQSGGEFGDQYYCDDTQCYSNPGNGMGLSLIHI